MRNASAIIIRANTEHLVCHRAAQAPCRCSIHSLDLLEWNDEPHDELLRRLRAHRAKTILSDDAFDAEDLSLGNAGDVAECDFEHLPVHDAIAHGAAEEPMMRIDLGQSVGELAPQLVDRLSRRHFASTAAAFRRMPRCPGRVNGVPAYRRP